MERTGALIAAVEQTQQQQRERADQEAFERPREKIRQRMIRALEGAYRRKDLKDLGIGTIFNAAKNTEDRVAVAARNAIQDLYKYLRTDRVPLFSRTVSRRYTMTRQWSPVVRAAILDLQRRRLKAAA
jgi:hypothetical protein